MEKNIKLILLIETKRFQKDNTSTDEVIKMLFQKYHSDFENILILQVTSPLRKISTLKIFINFVKKNLSYCLSVSLINDNISHKKKFLFRLKTIREDPNQENLIYTKMVYFILLKKRIY